MNVENIPIFSSSEEEAKYWKNLALEFKQKYQDAKDELDEFQINSRELEAELEAQLEQAEKRNKELKTLNNRLQVECESLKERLEKNHYENHNQISDLQEELGFIKALKDDLQKYIRELEQTNDDLERAKRATVVSLEDFESRLNQAIERNAFLESELDEKEALLVTVQRLKDEARDLRYELQIRNRNSLVNSPEPDNDRTCEKLFSAIDSNKLTVETETQTAPGSPVKTINQLTTTSTALTPSARISALNIVGDLLRKVGTLESKLASCRNFVKDSPRNYQTKNSPHHSPSAKYVLADSYGLSSGLRIRDAARTANKRPKQENPKEPVE